MGSCTESYKYRNWECKNYTYPTCTRASSVPSSFNKLQNPRSPELQVHIPASCGLNSSCCFSRLRTCACNAVVVSTGGSFLRFRFKASVFDLLTRIARTRNPGHLLLETNLRYRDDIHAKYECPKPHCWGGETVAPALGCVIPLPLPLPLALSLSLSLCLPLSLSLSLSLPLSLSLSVSPNFFLLLDLSVKGGSSGHVTQNTDPLLARSFESSGDSERIQSPSAEFPFAQLRVSLPLLLPQKSACKLVALLLINLRSTAQLLLFLQALQSLQCVPTGPNRT